jgi:hypothetical protein
VNANRLRGWKGEQRELPLTLPPRLPRRRSASEAVERLSGGRWRPSERSRVPLAADMVKASPEPPDKRLLAIAAKIVLEMRLLAGTPGEVYLRDVRKIDVAAIADVLARTDAIGWHPAVYFNGLSDDRPPHPLHGQTLGCIVGIMTDPVTAEPTGAISRTYLAPDGTKVGPAKTLGSPPGIVRLSRDEDVLDGLHIAEGLEGNERDRSHRPAAVRCANARTDACTGVRANKFPGLIPGPTQQLPRSDRFADRRGKRSPRP